MWGIASRVLRRPSERNVAAFAPFGASDAVPKLLILAILRGASRLYLPVSVLATQLSTLSNRVNRERLVLHDRLGSHHLILRNHSQNGPPWTALRIEGQTT